MSPAARVASPDTITLDAFNATLKRYPSLVRKIDASAAGSSKKTLTELDAFRYDEAPKLFSGNKPAREMNHDDVKALVEWKLRHGKFRPTLTKLVSENDSSVVKDTIRKAVSTYRSSATGKGAGNVKAALDKLVELRGIGPATASLLLSVHAPTAVIFFSDEAFYWLCNGGDKVSLKYNAKQYAELRVAAEELQERLDVSAMDVEKVAYVLMKDPDATADEAVESASAQSHKKRPAAAVKGKGRSSSQTEPGTKSPKVGEATAKSSTKRKSAATAQNENGGGEARRSKRIRG